MVVVVPYQDAYTQYDVVLHMSSIISLADGCKATCGLALKPVKLPDPQSTSGLSLPSLPAEILRMILEQYWKSLTDPKTGCILVCLVYGFSTRAENPHQLCHLVPQSYFSSTRRSGVRQETHSGPQRSSNSSCSTALKTS